MRRRPAGDRLGEVEEVLARVEEQDVALAIESELHLPADPQLVQMLGESVAVLMTDPDRPDDVPEHVAARLVGAFTGTRALPTDADLAAITRRVGHVSDWPARWPALPPLPVQPTTVALPAVSEPAEPWHPFGVPGADPDRRAAGRHELA